MAGRRSARDNTRRQPSPMPTVDTSKSMSRETRTHALINQTHAFLFVPTAFVPCPLLRGHASRAPL
eukprot:641399-Lingulodinium_polyedra.AAC.1